MMQAMKISVKDMAVSEIVEYQEEVTLVHNRRRANPGTGCDAQCEFINRTVR